MENENKNRIAAEDIEIKDGYMVLHTNWRDFGKTTAMKAAAACLGKELQEVLLKTQRNAECVIYGGKVYVFSSWYHFNTNVREITLREVQTKEGYMIEA